MEAPLERSTTSWLWCCFGPTTTLGILALLSLTIAAYFVVWRRDRRTGAEWLLVTWFVVFADAVLFVVNSFGVVGAPPRAPLEWAAYLWEMQFAAVARTVVPAVLSLPLCFVLDGNIRSIRLPIVARAAAGIDVVLVLLHLGVLIPS